MTGSETVRNQRTGVVRLDFAARMIADHNLDADFTEEISHLPGSRALKIGNAWSLLMDTLGRGPAIRNAGNRQRMTCSRAYQRTRTSASCTASSKRGTPTGIQKAARKTTVSASSTRPSLFQSIGKDPSPPRCAGHHALEYRIPDGEQLTSITVPTAGARTPLGVNASNGPLTSRTTIPPPRSPLLVYGKPLRLTAVHGREISDADRDQGAAGGG